MPSVRNALVVGGGIAGMTLGTALLRRGIRAEVVEINPAWSVLGIGISVQGATLRALKAIGVLDRCVASGFPYSSLIACDVNGKVTGITADGAYTNLLIHVYLRFTLVNTKSGQPLCTASNPAVKATFTNASSMQILTPDTPPTFPPNPSTSSTTTTMPPARMTPMASSTLAP